MLKRTILAGAFVCATAGPAFQAELPAFQAELPAWYPTECIAIDFCAPVDDAWAIAIRGSAPQLVISSMRREAIVTGAFAVGESRDGRVHVWMRYDPFGSLEVTCLLVPARML